MKVQKSKYAPGTIHETQTYGPIEILRLYPKGVVGNSNVRADIRYIRTGTVQNVQVSNIKAGKIWDCRHPTVYGVGYLDSYVKIPPRGKNNTYRRAYDMWCNMLKRAYHKSQEKHYSDVEVDVRWHSFRVFWNTIQTLPGYQDWVDQKYPRMSIDKDIKGGPQRRYSLDTCVFVSHRENTREALARRWGKEYEPLPNT